VPVILLTPNLSGADGISSVARLITRACDDVTVLALHEADRTTFDEVDVEGSNGRSSHFMTAATRWAVSTGRPTTVMVNHLHLAPAALAFAARGASLLTIVHGVEAWKPLTWLQRVALDSSERIIAVSAYTRDRFRAANPQFAQRRIDVCHLGLEPIVTSQGPAEWAPSALIVGRMASDERYKGHDLLIDIWRDVTADVPDAMLRIVGDGDDRARLEQKAVSMNLGTRIEFLGRISNEQLAREYQRCTAVVMPSRGEGFGLVFLEAMRAARGCIGAHGSASEIIVDGETGFVVDPRDHARLRQLLVRMFLDRTGTATMGVCGRARFLQHFTEDHFRHRLHALLPDSANPTASVAVSTARGV
jgi:phosphatidyl-myo-inositol dimannoside synthase